MVFHRLTVLNILLIFALTSTACETLAGEAALPQYPSFEIDPQFTDLYSQSGGAEILGPVISSIFTYGPIEYQYTVAGLLTHDPQKAKHAGYSLAPIGLDLGLLEVAVQPPDDPALYYADGHIIDPSFLPLYQKLGARLIGRPLTEARYNPKKRRIEQYFENLGFYRLESDPESVGLLAYGAWKCGTDCQPSPSQISGAEVVPPSRISPEFRKTVDRLGLHFTGFALGPAYTAPDGALEQVYENIILALPQGQGERVSLRPIPESLGIKSEAPVPPSSDPNLYFYPLDGDRGHNIPQAFLDYLAGHGGLDATGPPINEPTQIAEGVYRQCFTNLCLEEHTQETGTLKIRPSPLGFEFWEAHNGSLGQGGDTIPTSKPGPESDPTNQPYPAPTETLSQLSSGGVMLNVWKKFPVLSAHQSQEIGVIVLQDGLPVPDLHADLTLTLPDGEKVKIIMPPTGSDGQSYCQLSPIDAMTGHPIDYQVCVYVQAGQPTCAEDSFLIWK